MTQPTKRNAIAAWLFIIGIPERAKKLRNLLDKLPLGYVELEPIRDCNGKDAGTRSLYHPPMCPTVPLFGQRESAKLYADPNTRAALDAWDTQQLTKEDISRFCIWIERGRYRGEAFQPGQKNGQSNKAAA